MLRNTPGWQVAPPGLSLRQWLRGAGPRPVQAEDLHQHLKSLVPPVRACGHLEFRMVDAQGDDDWVVPLALIAALLDDEATSDAVTEYLVRSLQVPTREDWLVAAVRGLEHPSLSAQARTVVTFALEGVRRLGLSHEVVTRVERFADMCTLRGLSPAQHRLRDLERIA